MRKNILKNFRKINKIDNIEKQIIVINDGSNDNTLSILKNECTELFDEIINCKNNKGKGHA